MNLLADRLRNSREQILSEWEKRVRIELSDAKDESHLELIDSLPVLLDRLTVLLEQNKTTLSDVKKSATISKEHGQHRVGQGYDFEEVLLEYQILRQVIFDVLEVSGPVPAPARDLILDFIQFSTREAALEFIHLQNFRNLKPWQEIGISDSLFRIFVSFATVVVATVLQWLIWPFVEPAPYLLYYPAIIFGSLFGNGVLTVVLSALTAEYFFNPPLFSLHPPWPNGWIRLIVFVLSSWMIAFLSKRLREAYRKAIMESQRTKSFAEKRDALAKIGSQSLGAENFQAVCESSIQWIARALQAPYAKILRYDREQNAFIPLAYAGIHREQALSSQAPFDPNSLAGRALKSQKVISVRNFEGQTHFSRPALIPDSNIQSGMAVQIQGSSQPYGALVIQDIKPREFTDDERFFLSDAGVVLANTIQRYSAEEALRKSQRHLHETNVGLESENRILELHRQELTRSNRELSRFAGIAAHDLKSPLNTISQFIDLIQFEIEHSLTPQLQNDFQFILNAVDRMRNLIDRLLVYARAGSKSEPLKPVDMNQVVEIAQQNLKSAIDGNHARLQVDRLPVVLGDEVELTQVIQNLIANALKFKGAEDPRIEIKATEKQNCWEISVADNGVGIASPDLSKIFEPFMRSGDRQSEGTGLGLAIVQKIIERHQGKIWVESTLGKGSVFYLSLPQIKNLQAVSRSPVDSAP